jgi:hypothetical protein
MKSEISPELLEEYLDGEPAAEEEFYARYDRDLPVPVDLWARIESEIAPVQQSSLGWWSKIAALILLSIGLLSYVLLRPSEPAEIAVVEIPRFAPAALQTLVKPGPEIKRIKRQIHTDKKEILSTSSDVISTDLGFDMDDQDTAKHIEQTENLLRSIRNFPVSDTDDEVDVSYDKALSRRLLNENVVLRRDAEMKAKFPTKTLLADLEPFLIDIANLPDRAKPEDVRVIKERVQKTEIVAALVEYQDRGTNNR